MEVSISEPIHEIAAAKVRHLTRGGPPVHQMDEDWEKRMQMECSIIDSLFPAHGAAPHGSA
jgi:hypothetical protein